MQESMVVVQMVQRGLQAKHWLLLREKAAAQLMHWVGERQVGQEFGQAEQLVPLKYLPTAQEVHAVAEVPHCWQVASQAVQAPVATKKAGLHTPQAPALVQKRQLLGQAWQSLLGLPLSWNRMGQRRQLLAARQI
jgi:hypothetical protein